MKANRKFVQADDHAVSAVIGVILMVAITVAIAATVYVYVSGMIGGGPAKTFPQIRLTDSTNTTTATGGDYLFTMEHRAGETINWADYDIEFRWAGNNTPIPETTGRGIVWDRPANALPIAGVFSVTDTILIAEDPTYDVVGADGDTLKVVIVDKTSKSIVYENTITVS